MFRILTAASLAATLFATNLLAAEAVAPAPAQISGPLAPGQAAGVSKAQTAAGLAIWAGALGVAGVLIASGVSQGGGVHLPTATLPTPAAVST